MKDNQVNLYGLLEKLSTEQLDEMLQTELQEESVDENAVRVILRVLREREAGLRVEVDEAAQKAWAQYSKEQSVTQPAGKWGWARRAAAVAAILAVVLLIAPTTANAERIYGMLTRWTDSIFEFFDPSDKDTNSVEYEFRTDHAGLQQVYDTVVELGVTDPVVPMWIPEEYELTEIKKIDTPRKKFLSVNFYNGHKHLVYELDLYDENASRVYPKDEENVEHYEYAGVTHQAIRNFDLWTVIWSRGPVECFITVDCQEDILQRILQSIYYGGS